METWILVICSVVVIVLYHYGSKFYKIYKKIQASVNEKIPDPNEAAFKQKLREEEEKLKANPVDVVAKLGYDPANNDSLQNFKPVMLKTHCLFAKSSKLWSCRPFNSEQSLEEYVEKNRDALDLFMKLSKGLHLEGFLFEIYGDEFTKDVEKFGQAVRRILTKINPECMSKSYIDKRGWFFEYQEESFFVTTVCECYPSTSSRYTFGTKGGFILLQPEFSFVWKDIGLDTPITNWENPQTIRDKIRVEFKKHGRMYEIPDTVYYPAAYGIIPPTHLGGDVVKWWIKK